VEWGPSESFGKVRNPRKKRNKRSLRIPESAGRQGEKRIGKQSVVKTTGEFPNAWRGVSGTGGTRKNKGIGRMDPEKGFLEV